MADFQVAKNLGPRTEQDTAADFRMTVAILLAGPAKGHPLQDRHIILDHRSAANDDACAMVDEDTLPHWDSRMDVDLENFR